MKVEQPRATTSSAGKPDGSDLIDKVIGSVCFAFGIGLLLWSGFGLSG
jgi:hypothetical protein